MAQEVLPIIAHLHFYVAELGRRIIAPTSYVV